MGTSRWDPTDWTTKSTTYAAKSTADIYTSRSVKDIGDLNPKDIKMRESCDSTLNPLATPIIVAIDVTGSMNVLADTIIKKGLGVVVEQIYDRKPVTDPHLMLMAFGDVEAGDTAPLQVTQFEADTTIADQCEKFYIEKGGGGNHGESYNLPWYFAATRTKCDAFLKRNKKGYLFTVGDEDVLDKLRKQDIKTVFGDDVQHDLDTRDVLSMATKTWEVFHILIDEDGSKLGNHTAPHRFFHGEPGKAHWKNLLGQRVLTLDNATDLAELIVSTIQVNEGADVAAVAGSWSGSTALTIRKALDTLTTEKAATGVKRL